MLTILFCCFCLQQILYFPLQPRIKALMRTKKYFDMCQHEFLRPKPHDPNVVADVYDSPAWRDFMGPATYPNKRLGFVFCIDAVPAFAEGSHSVKPGVFSNFSLPPTERGKPENMILLIVIPTKIKDPNVKKYFDFSATYELDDLFINGVEGVKIKIFTTTMDTPGRSELMGLLSGVCLLFSSLTHSLTYYLHVCRYAKRDVVPGLPGLPPFLDRWQYHCADEVCLRRIQEISEHELTRSW